MMQGVGSGQVTCRLPLNPGFGPILNHGSHGSGFGQGQGNAGGRGEDSGIFRASMQPQRGHSSGDKANFPLSKILRPLQSQLEHLYSTE